MKRTKTSRLSRSADQASGRRRWALAVLLLIGAAGAYAAWRSMPGQNSPDDRLAQPRSPETSPLLPAEAVSPPPLPEIAKSPYLNTRPDSKYVGSAACQECHAGEHESYLATGHSRSFARVDPREEPPDGEFQRREPGWIYRAYRSDGELRHQEVLETPDGERTTLVDHPAAYLMGSGRFARTYLIELDGVFVESPLTWYASTESWRLSPGYERDVRASFCRNVGQSCAFCHVGRTETKEGSEFRLAIQETAIGCERCHGPGSLHVERHRASAAPAGERDLTIVNPSDLPRELAESVCNQCHLESVTSAIVRGRRREDFRPGLRWSDFVVNYEFDRPSGDMTVTGHVQQLRQSACYQQSDSLTCITCHDPHDAPEPAARLAYHRRQCLDCHADQGCKVPEPERLAKNQDDCMACHMPRSDTNVPHVAFTHHRIGIHSPRGDGGEGPLEGGEREIAQRGPGELRPVLGDVRLPPLDQERTLGLAYMRLAVDNLRGPEFPLYRDRSESILRQVAAAGIQDPAVQAALTIHDQGQGDLRSARKRAEAALADPAISPLDRITATHALASMLVQQGDFRAADREVRKLTQWRVAPGDWYLLARCLREAGDLDGAIAAMERLIEIDPTEPKAYGDLAAMYHARGDSDRARQALERQRLIQGALDRAGASAR